LSRGLVARDVLTVVLGFELGRRGGVVGDLTVEASVAEPVDVGEGGELDIVETAPGAAPIDELSLVETVEALLAGAVETSQLFLVAPDALCQDLDGVAEVGDFGQDA